MNRNIKLFLISLIFLTATNVSSQTVSEKGIASIELDRTTCREGRPTDRNKHFEAIDFPESNFLPKSSIESFWDALWPGIQPFLCFKAF